MKEDFEKWQCKLILNKDCFDKCEDCKEVHNRKEAMSIVKLVKAMWTINENYSESYEDAKYICIEYLCIPRIKYQVTHFAKEGLGIKSKDFYKCKYNNSEQEALQAALEYIFDNKEKN